MSAALSARRQRKSPPDLGDARDEMNLAEFPISLLTEHGPRHLKTLEHEDIIYDSKTGQSITRKQTITGSDKYGLPTSKDDDVILGLLLLTKQANNFTDRTVYFSRYQLVHLLGWSENGKSYRRLEESLDRWMSVYLSYEKAWWDNERKSWVDAKFHILDDALLYEQERSRRKRAGQTALPFSSFTWSKIVFQSFQSGYVRRLRLDFFLSLKTPISKRLYRFLDKHFYHRPGLEFDLEDLAFAHVGLSRGYHTGKIKEKLAPAIEELEAKGFLEPLSPSERYVQVCRGEWKVIFVKKGKDTAALPTPAVTTPPLQKELTDRGVTASTAAELVATEPAERITAKLEIFDWMMEKNDKRLSQNPAGYLVASIRGEYATPKDFEPKAERERKKQAAEEKRRQKEGERIARRRQEEQEMVARKAERMHIDAYLNALTPQERKALEEQAVAHADENMRRAAQDGSPMAAVARRVLVDREILRLCPLPAPQT
jgi:Replication initiator protein A